MKHLKKYESRSEQLHKLKYTGEDGPRDIFWKVTNLKEPYLEATLYKISKLCEKDINLDKITFYKWISNDKDYTKDGHIYFGYSYKFGYQIFHHVTNFTSPYLYKGEITATNDDVKKYEIVRDANKYNL